MTAGMAVAPHYRAAETGAAMLRAGASAIEATVAMAAMISVVYPHMTGIGGDAFWLVAAPGKAPVAIDGAGRAAALATPGFYAAAGLTTIPWRGPLAANMSAGAIASWSEALTLAKEWTCHRVPLSQLLKPAIEAAEDGIEVTRSQAALTAEKWDELKDVPGFTATYAPAGRPPAPGEKLVFPKLASTLGRLACHGLEDYYTGSLAHDLAHDLQTAGTPLRLEDLAAYRAQRRTPLQGRINGVTLYNHPPPTQGLASLVILELFERLEVTEAEGFARGHEHRALPRPCHADNHGNALRPGDVRDGFTNASILERTCAEKRHIFKDVILIETENPLLSQFQTGNERTGDGRPVSQTAARILVRDSRHKSSHLRPFRKVRQHFLNSLHGIADPPEVRDHLAVCWRRRKGFGRRPTPQENEAGFHQRNIAYLSGLIRRRPSEQILPKLWPGL